MRTRIYTRGVTLIEVVLAVAMVGTLFGLSFVAHERLLESTSLDAAVRDAQSLLYQAEIASRTGSGAASWGVAFLPQQAVLFKGSSYVSRDTGYDQTIDLHVDTSGTSEYVFAALSGLPVEPGETTFISNSAEASSTISVSSHGTITTQ